MPTYTYRNTITGEEWSEVRRIEDRLNGVDGRRIILLLSTPHVADPSTSTKRRYDFHDKVIEPMKKKYHGNNLP